MKTAKSKSLQKELFSILGPALCANPTRIRAGKGYSGILFYFQCKTLTGKKKPRKNGLQPLVNGKILKPLNEKAEEKLIRYLGS